MADSMEGGLGKTIVNALSDLKKIRAALLADLANTSSYELAVSRARGQLALWIRDMLRLAKVELGTFWLDKLTSLTSAFENLYQGEPHEDLLEKIDCLEGEFVEPLLQDIKNDRVSSNSAPSPRDPGSAHQGPGEAVVAQRPAQKARHVVALIHGIRTEAAWAEMVRVVLEQTPGVEVVPLRYGYFDVLRFLSPVRTREKPIRRVEQKIRAILATTPDCDVSVIAHSYGTYVICRLLENDPGLRLRRLVLCGSVVGAEYRWDKVANQISDRWVLNECGTEDVWPLFAAAATWRYGPTGTFGFGDPKVRDRFHRMTHSDYFSADFVRGNWIPYIERGEIAATEWETTRPTPHWWQSFLGSGMPRVAVIALLALVVLIGIGRAWLVAHRSASGLLPLSTESGHRVAAVRFSTELSRKAPKYCFTSEELLVEIQRTIQRELPGCTASTLAETVQGSPGPISLDILCLLRRYEQCTDWYRARYWAERDPKSTVDYDVWSQGRFQRVCRGEGFSAADLVDIKHRLGGVVGTVVDRCSL